MVENLLKTEIKPISSMAYRGPLELNLIVVLEIRFQFYFSNK